jgi:chorismate synthase
VSLTLVTAGESHGPALVAILSGLPAGLVLDRATIDADLRRRQQGYGRSPRQQIETDEVEVLAGLRRGRTLGTPLALVVPNRDHRNWRWGMGPWPLEGEPEGKGAAPVTLPRPGHADLAGVLKYGLEDVRDALERASARHTAVFVAAGSVARQLLATIEITVDGSVLEIGGERGQDAIRAAIDAASRPGSAATPSRRSGWTAGWPRRCSPSRRSRASRSATASSWRAGAGRRPTTRSSATSAASTARPTAPAASRAASRTGRRSSCGRR